MSTFPENALDDRRELRRWLICGVVVLCVHGGLATALVQWHERIEAGDFGEDTIELELTPEQVQGDPDTDKPVEKVEEEKTEPLPEEDLEVTLPAKPPDPVPVPKPVATASPDQVTRVQQVQRRIAGAAAWDSAIRQAARAQQALSGRGARPRRAGRRAAQLHHRPDGRVLSSRIARSSGSPALDQETLALVERAQPFPRRRRKCPAPSSTSTCRCSSRCTERRDRVARCDRLACTHQAARPTYVRSTSRTGLEQLQKSSVYSITWSASESMAGGTARPSALAVLRLMTKSNLVDCCTGRSAGFSPLRMRPT